jgi:membrane protease subunit HflK
MNWDWEKLKEQQQRMGGGPPQMDEFIKKFKNIKFPFKIPGGPLLLLIILLVAFGSSTFYTISVDEVGIVQRFGKYVRTSQPGLNFKLPAIVEKVTKVKVRRVYKEEFGEGMTGSEDKMRYGADVETSDVTLMLTGDLNVAVVPWIVQYRIKDPYNYLFKVQNVRRLLLDMSEATMRLVVGDRSINEVITKRDEIATEAKELLQKEIDKAETGIQIVTIEMKRTNVPGPVQPSFNEVNQAVQEKEKVIYQAKEDYNKAIPQAKGEAERTIKEAEGYSLDRINRAKGDATRFVSLYKEYVNAKDVTKRRLYLEALQDLFPKLGQKVIVDEQHKNFLPFLNLSKPAGDAK